MDCGSVYIKQCDCPEIQEQCDKMDSKSFFVNGKKRQIWLPRQDQLQEMLLEDFVQQDGGYLPTYWLLHKFEQWLPDCRYVATSMEQLWLPFYMKSCYNKEWRNGQWE